MKIYVYRIDIWMNILIRNIPDLDSPFYDLKLDLLNYFLSIAGGEEPKIVKFYGANVNPEILKRSLNELFFQLLTQTSLTDKFFQNPQLINSILENNRIYKILKKMFMFYNILIRHDVQSNYLHSFMERKIQNIDQNTCNL